MNSLVSLSGETGEEICDITLLVQNGVEGSQLIDFNLEELNSFNPCIFDNLRPYVLLVYLQRGKLKLLVRACTGRLSLGGFRQTNSSLRYRLGRAWARAVDYLVN
jgi:hypothetical protein